ncbi:MAG: FAD-dependent oxidoreductase [Acidimicrobiia bacterium]|nr:FAD-dependent oxidoreductase [Acidimicrobiia bacterium]
MAEAQDATGPDLRAEGIPVDEIHPERPAAGRVDGDAVIVVAVDGGFRALAGRCTHYGGPLGDGICADGTVRCPWHHAAFDVATGAAVGAPALDAVATYDVDVRDGRVFVTGERSPEPADLQGAPPASVVIVGAGAAGTSAVVALRREGYEGPVALIGPEDPVDRPNLSKDYLAGDAPEEWLPLRPDGWFEDHGVVRHPYRAVTVDRERRIVHLDDGTPVEYDALLLAPGASPKTLPVDGIDRSHVHLLRTADDARAIVDEAESASTAVVIGAGFIGLEVAASLRARDVAVTVVAPEPLPLGTILGEHLGSFVRDIHEEHGVSFRLGHTPAAIGDGTVTLDDDETIAADLVVVGVGVDPRTDLAASIGLDVADGIVVDSTMRTSDPAIWAAGDAARQPDPRAGSIRVEHWVHAERQGAAAARSMLGLEPADPGPPFFWSQHYDVPINVTGTIGDWDETVVHGDAGDRDVLVGYLDGDRIVAVASIYRDLDSLRAERALAVGDQAVLRELLGLD